jgi:hypothetical protein
LASASTCKEIESAGACRQNHRPELDSIPALLDLARDRRTRWSLRWEEQFP